MALNVQGSASLAGSSKSYSGVATGRSRDCAAAFQNQPPMWDFDGLDPEPIAADVREEHLARHLALAEAGDLDDLGEIVRGVLDRVLELVRRDVDREADAVAAELLHLGHAAIQAVALSRPTDVGARYISAHGAIRSNRAGVAELADAPGLGPGGLRPLEVRVLSPA